MQVLSLGNIGADFACRVDSAIWSREQRGHDLMRLGGGKAANVALQARRLGVRALLLGRVGDDDLAAQALDTLLAAGVDVSGVRRVPGATGVAFIAVPPSGDQHSVAVPGVNLGYDETDMIAIERAVETADPGAVLVVDWDVTPHAVTHAITCARRRGLRVVADPVPPKMVDRADLRHVHALVPNEAEAVALAGLGHDDPIAAARMLAALGPALVCVRLAGGGCHVRHDGWAWQQQAAPGPVVDTTGAGDAFVGALAVALAEGRDEDDAVEWAVAASEVAVGRFGAQPGCPTRAEVDGRWRGAKRQRVPL
jgi:ribokinase